VGVSGLGKNRRFWGVLVYTWQPIYPIFGVSNRLQPETGFKPVATDFPIAVAHHYSGQLASTVREEARRPGCASQPPRKNRQVVVPVLPRLLLLTRESVEA
jgi:hypothetical protein